MNRILRQRRIRLGGNAYNLSSGIYFYTLQASGYTQTKKLILLK
ncbi:MAG: T9SS type A sorting domain-containing protein [Ignavibacteriales bacterium]|nr:T9SS type A sorting domain-containing protein [Ignavibacteriales bacterium]